MPTIEISDTDFKRLQKIAVPLVDTTATAFSRLLDYYEGDSGAPPDAAPPTPQGPALIFGAKNVPPMVHTKLLDGRFDGRAPEKVNWDGLVRMALVSTIDSCGSAKELHRLSGANVVSGTKVTDGYKHVPSHDFSYQGVSAEGAVDIVVRCAKALGRGAHVEFEWRNKDGAHRPGERAVLSVTA